MRSKSGPTPASSLPQKLLATIQSLVSALDYGSYVYDNEKIQSRQVAIPRLYGTLVRDGAAGIRGSIQCRIFQEGRKERETLLSERRAGRNVLFLMRLSNSGQVV
jgi:hypothetical protein